LDKFKGKEKNDSRRGQHPMEKKPWAPNARAPSRGEKRLPRKSKGKGNTIK